MALIENVRGRLETQPPSGYTRLFGIAALGNLMSRVQGAVIASGTELENLIWARVNRITDLDAFLLDTLHSTEDRVYVARKDQSKRSKAIQSKYEPDFLAFNPSTRHCYIIEVKDGDQFDTKKSSSEHTTLHAFNNDISSAISYGTTIHLCCFNVRTREEIVHGLKGKFALDEVLTGRELCMLLEIDFDEIVAIRQGDQRRNLEYFLTELLKIMDIRVFVANLLEGLRREDYLGAPHEEGECDRRAER